MHRRVLCVIAFVLCSARVASAAETPRDGPEARRLLSVRTEAGPSLAGDGDPILATRAAFGARLARWTLGVGFTYYRGSVATSNEGGSMPVWGYLLGPELTLHFPIGIFEPFIAAETGYFHSRETIGGVFGLAAGADVYVSRTVSLGLALKTDELYSSQNGELNTGLVSAALRLAFHFDP
jgi:hypothetical protein